MSRLLFNMGLRPKPPSVRFGFLFVFAGSLLAGSALVYGCGDDDVNLAPKGDAGAPEVFSVPEAAPPPPPSPPKLGVQRDRAGRPLINTLANHSFDLDAGAPVLAAEDTYNFDDKPADWSTFEPEIAKNLAIYDGLDTTCGNQTLGDAGVDGAADRYTTLATMLADDRLWLDSSQSTCTQYLAVETGKTTDCGGRGLAYDVVDSTYNLVVSGLASTAITDGVAKVGTKTDGTTFPYLVAPQ